MTHGPPPTRPPSLPSRLASSLRDAPTSTCPRERLLTAGPATLSDAELLGLFLSGTHGDADRHVDRLGAALMVAGGLAGLRGQCLSSLRGCGLEPEVSATLLAGFELARRLALAEVPDRHPMKRPEAVAEYLRLSFGGRDQEILGALFLNSRDGLLACREIYRGALGHASVEPRGVLKEGLLLSAATFVLFHTHPSGNPEPSVEDRLFTRRLADAGDVVGIRLVDHLIVGARGRWVSLARIGGW